MIRVTDEQWEKRYKGTMECNNSDYLLTLRENMVR